MSRGEIRIAEATERLHMFATLSNKCNGKLVNVALNLLEDISGFLPCADGAIAARLVTD